jgi:hypothetical protein
MVDWMKWAFEGVGGAGAVAALGFLFKRYFFKESQAPKVQTLDNAQTIYKSPGTLSVSGPITGSVVAVGDNNQQSFEVHHHHSGENRVPELTESKPSPDQIFEDIDRLPPFQTHQARSNYLNLNVCWQVVLESIQPLGTGYIIHVRYSKGTKLVSFTTESLHPELKIAKHGTPMWIKVKIKHLQTFCVVLSEATILNLEHL